MTPDEFAEACPWAFAGGVRRIAFYEGGSYPTAAVYPFGYEWVDPRYSTKKENS